MNYGKALEILDVPRNTEDIKAHVRKQYRKLSLQHHPDRGGSAEKFEQITTAYEFIMNDTVDQTVSETVNNHTNANVNVNVNTNASNFPPNVVQIFNQTYSSMPTHLNAADMFVGNLKYVMDVTTTEAFHGCTKTISIKRTRQGASDVASYSVNIAPGSYHGQEIIISGAGRQNAVGMVADLIIQLNEINDTDFIRDKQNLTFKVSVTLRNALLGSTLNIRHPSGKMLTVNYRLSNPTTVTILPCKGMPIYGTTNCYGDLKIEFNVLFPTNIPPHLVIDLDGVLSALDYTI